MEVFYLPGRGGRLKKKKLAFTNRAPTASIGMDDGADVLAVERRRQQLRFETVDDLQPLDQARPLQQIEQDLVERQRRQTAGPQLGDADLPDQARRRMPLGVGVVEAVDVLDQGEGL